MSGKDNVGATPFIRGRVKSRISLLAFALLAVALSIIFMPGIKKAHAATCAVPSGYTTISLALAAGAGTCDTINVAAGTYKETLTITYPVTLQGAGAATTIIQDPATVNPFADILISINASNVTIDGFTISGAGAFTTNNAVFTTKTSTNLNIQHNVVQNFFHGIVLTGPDDTTESGGNVISNNTISGIYGQGRAIEMYNNFYATVQNNTITDAYIGISSEYATAGTGTTPMLITGNTITSRDTGLYFRELLNTPVPYTISGNTMHTAPITDAATQNQRGMLFVHIDGSTSLSVSNNNVDGALIGAYICGVSGAAGLTISGGTLDNNTNGVILENKSTNPVLCRGQDTRIPPNIFTFGGLVTLSGVTIQNSIDNGIWIRDTDNTQTAANFIKLVLTNATAITNFGIDGVKIQNPNAQFVPNNAAFSGQSGSQLYMELVVNPIDIDATATTFEGVLGNSLSGTQLQYVKDHNHYKLQDNTLGDIFINQTGMIVAPKNMLIKTLTTDLHSNFAKFSITNTALSPGTLAWSLGNFSYTGDLSNWLSCAATSGSLVPGNSVDVNCTLAAIGRPGTYQVTIPVDSVPTIPPILNPNQVVTIILIVGLPEPGDLVAQLRVTPDREVSNVAGSLVTYNILVKNISNSGIAQDINVRVPIDPNLETGYATFTNPKAWVKAIVLDAPTPYVLIGLPNLGAGVTVGGTLVFRVKQADTTGASLFARFTVDWYNGIHPVNTTSNGARVFFSANGDRNETDGNVLLFSPPTSQVKSGDSLDIVSDFYAPSEIVDLWYTDKNGQSVSLGYQWANRDGILVIHLSTNSLIAGESYVVAGHGRRSDIIGSAVLYILP
ncbi:MAG: hypothetical protein HXX08_07345 [Chloroflexi bacterium]|uniref:Carbohydrate-binding/sugar hydrolysis domain-containing protein n=1 Tax=Candidatus Chlorohelix allophototropha TaxID=3003348 RepID=A0A8T7LUG0_9CHLR|nr:hypothetical protein [Chloroflexota bacterium]WJW67547.1 hypothetical protein OZ401_000814 [Chloroflexota bacterium L227-S17]